MNGEARTDRSTAVTVGVLYIIATAMGGVAVATIGDPAGLAELAGHRSGVLLAALAESVMALALMGLAAMLYPILRRDAGTPAQHGLSVWYLGTRISEGSIFLVGVGALLAALELSNEVQEATPGLMAGAEVTGAALLTLSEYAWIAGQTVFCVGAAILAWLLLRSGRVPRWLALWGLVAAPLMLIAGFLLPITGDPSSTVSTILYAPMGLQELVLAVWLIGWGFHRVAGDSRRLERSTPRSPATTS